MACAKENPRFKELLKFLRENGADEKLATDYLIKKSIVTRGEFCDNDYALREYTALHGGDEQRENIRKIVSQNNQAISKGAYFEKYHLTANPAYIEHVLLSISSGYDIEYGNVRHPVVRSKKNNKLYLQNPDYEEAIFQELEYNGIPRCFVTLKRAKFGSEIVISNSTEIRMFVDKVTGQAITYPALEEKVSNEDNNQSNIDSEMQSIKDAAIANGTFMKAPNGQPTHLNERQWLQVRTKAFKDWFGDWEKVISVTSTAYDTVGGSPVALSYLLEDGPNTIKSTGYLLHGISAAFILITPEIETIRSKYLNKLDDNPINFIKDTSGALQEIKNIIEKTYGQQGLNILNDILKNATGFYKKDGEKIESRLNELNSTLKNSLIKNVSKVVDENGEPLVVYHGGANDIEEFKLPNNSIKIAFDRFEDLDWAKENGYVLSDDDIKRYYNGEDVVVYKPVGVYFSDYDIMAKSYFGRQNENDFGFYQVFLNIRTPYITNKNGKQMINDSGTVKDLQFAKDNNNDGVIIENVRDYGPNDRERMNEETKHFASDPATDYIIFNPNQVKSATDNNGAFSKDDNRIRFKKEKRVSDIEKFASRMGFTIRFKDINEAGNFVDFATKCIYLESNDNFSVNEVESAIIAKLMNRENYKSLVDFLKSEDKNRTDDECFNIIRNDIKRVLNGEKLNDKKDFTYLEKIRNFIADIISKIIANRTSYNNFIETITNDAISENSEWFNQSSGLYGDSSDVVREKKIITLDTLKDDKLFPAYNVIVRYGGALDGSGAIRAYGDLFRPTTDEFHDFDFTIKYNNDSWVAKQQLDIFSSRYVEYWRKNGSNKSVWHDMRNAAIDNIDKHFQKTYFFNQLKKYYKDVHVKNSWYTKGLGLCVQIQVDDKSIDMFFNDRLNKSEKNGVVVTDYSNAFTAKLTMLRNKDIRDIINFRINDISTPLYRDENKKLTPTKPDYVIDEDKFKENNASNGRELFTSELMSIIPLSGKQLKSIKDRNDIAEAINNISTKYGVEFVHKEENEVWEKDRWICNDRLFIEFLKLESSVPSKKFRASVAKWNQFKKIFNLNDKSIDAQYARAHYNAEKMSRAEMFAAFAKKYNIKDYNRLMNLFSDPRNLENLDIDEDDRFILNKVQDEVNYWESRYPSISDITDEENHIVVDDLNKPKTDTRSSYLINKLTNSLGIPSRVISEEEASHIIESNGVHYDGNLQCSFYLNGVIYFIEGKIDSSTAIHEFSHPLIQAIKNDNRILFDNLFNSLVASSAWDDIHSRLERDYPELKENSDEYIEEALVFAMEYAHEGKYNNDKFFKSFIDKIIYALKQLFRNIFGQEVNLSQLSINTTIGDLEGMLELGVKFDLSSVTSINDDIIHFKKSDLDLGNEIEHVFHDPSISIENNIKDFNKATSSFFNALQTYKNELIKNGDVEKLKDLQTNLFGSGVLDRMISQMKDANGNEKFASLTDEQIYAKRCQLFADSLSSMTELIDQIEQDISKMDINNLSQEDCRMLYSYNNLLNYWLKFMTKKLDEDIKNASIETGVNPDRLNTITKSITNSINRAKEKINRFYLEIATDTLYDQLQPIYQRVEDKFHQRLEQLRANPNVTQEYIDREYKRYTGMTETEYEEFNQLYEDSVSGLLSIERQNRFESLKIKSRLGQIKSKAQIKDYIRGEFGDADWLNTKFESYMYSTDPIIGGFAAFHKKHLEKAINRTIGNYNKFQERVAPLLEKIGHSKLNIGGLGKQLGFKDKIWEIDESGVGHEKEVWTFINQFKGYRVDISKLRNEIKIAKNNYDINMSQENYDALKKAEQDYNDFCYNFMNQEYVPEYYDEFRKLYNTPEGKLALERREFILQQIEEEEDFIKSNEYIGDPIEHAQLVNSLNTIEELKRQLRQLASPIDEYGNEKTGEDKVISDVLTEYNKSMSKFKENIYDYEGLDRDFLEFRQSLLDAGIYEGTDKYNEEIELWQRHNMSYGTTAEFNTLRQEALDKLLTLLERYGYGNSEEWAKIFAMVNGSKNWEGHVDPSKITKDQIQKIKDLQESMAGSSSGRMPEELKRAFAEYNALINRIPTQYYMDSMKSIFEDAMLTSSDLLEIFGTTDYEAIADSLSGVVPLEVLDKLEHHLLPTGNKYSNLLEWFNDMHFLKGKTSGGAPIYGRYYIYDVVRPADDKYEVKHDVVDPETGVVVATLKGVAAGRYSKSVVKDTFKTPKIVGETVDNNGNWLPKSRAQMASLDLSKHPNLSSDPNDPNYMFKYINEEYEDIRDNNPELFEVLELFKEQHLANQEGVSDKNKLYLDMPRYVKDSAEILSNVPEEGVSNTLKRFWIRLKQFFQGSPDDFENGAANYTEAMDINKSLVHCDSIEDEMSSAPVGGLYHVDADDCSTNIVRTMWRYAADCDREKSLREASPFAKAIEVSVQNNEIKSKNFDQNLLEASGILERLGRKSKGFDGAKNLRKEAIQNFIEQNYQGIKLKGHGANNPILMRIANMLMGRASFSFFAFNIPSALKNSYGIKFQALLEATANQHMNPITLEKGNRWSHKAMAAMAVNGNYDPSHQKTFEKMVIEQFDMAQDTAGSTFMDPLWRSVGTDVLDGKLLTAPRKWLEQQATYQVGAGILYFKKVSFIDPDSGEIKDIDYMDALEIRDGVLRTKSGVDIRYDTMNTTYVPQEGDTYESIARKFNLREPGSKDTPDGSAYKNGVTYVKKMTKNNLEKMISNLKKLKDEYQQEIEDARLYLTGEELNNKIKEIEDKYQKGIKENTITFENERYESIRNEIHQTNNDLGGAYADFDQPEMHRYFLYRVTFYLRRYFTTMFMKRFRWRERLNPGMSDYQQGYYIQAIKALGDVIKSKGKYITMMSPEEKRAIIRTASEFVLLAAIPILAKILFGYDPDDDERYEKLRSKSGALPTPFTRDNPDRKFNALGFLSNHTLHLLLQIRQENEQFLPGMGGIKQLEGMTDIKSVMFGPTTDQITQIGGDLINMLQGEDGPGYYTREVGPYEWQDKGDAKVWNHMMKILALTGTSVDPALAIQNYEANRAKVRR